MITANNEDVVVLVRVTPYGTAEREFMQNIDDIREATNYTRLACQLEAFYGWETPDGKPYNQYELDFDSENWLWYGYEFLEKWFAQMNDIEGEITPQVVAARRSVK